MQSTAATPDEYVEELPEERKQAINELRKVIKKNIPKGFVEEMSYGMIGYVVPHSLYAPGYHCNPKLPLPFMSIASQKNFIAVYNMGMYVDEELFNWYLDEYTKQTGSKTKDMGKSCLRFKKPEQIPFKLIGELAKKMTPQQWIQLYEQKFKR